MMHFLLRKKQAGTVVLSDIVCIKAGYGYLIHNMPR